MVNEKRVKQMIRVTMFDKKYGDYYKPIIHYKKKDFVAAAGMSAFFSGTLFYLIVYALIVVSAFGSVIENPSKSVIIMLAVVGLSVYTLYIFIHVTLARTEAKRQYKRGRRAIRLLAAEYDELENIYQEEEKQTGTY